MFIIRHSRLLLVSIIIIAIFSGGCGNNKEGIVEQGTVATLNGENVTEQEINSLIEVDKFQQEVVRLCTQQNEEDAQECTLNNEEEILLNKENVTDDEKAYLAYLQMQKEGLSSSAALKEICRIKLLLQYASENDIVLSQEQAKKMVADAVDLSSVKIEEENKKSIYEVAATNKGYNDLEDLIKQHEMIFIENALVIQLKHELGDKIFLLADRRDMADTTLNRHIAWMLFEEKMIAQADIKIHKSDFK